ncbi:MAG: 16S rRNA (guanine(527)-N(7))-methyltransferase RsmG [Cyclobacteriaceae bacterium]
MNQSIVYKYFPDLNPNQVEQIDRLGELYVEWNQKINVISRKDIEELYERHVLHSLAIAKFCSFPNNSQILDIGTGGGFPGIPLAILFPNCHFHLVDSIAKKIKVVSEVSKAIDLKNLTCEHQRAEKIKSKYDYIVSRAVARSKQLTNWTSHLIKTNEDSFSSGYVLLKGGDLSEELKEIKRNYQEIDIKNYFEEPFFDTKKIIYIPY